MAYCMPGKASQNGNGRLSQNINGNGLPVDKKNRTILAKFSEKVDKNRCNGRNSRAPNGQRFDARYKIVLLGESGVGKTSLIRATTGEPFIPTMISTIGIDFVNQNLDVENKIIQLQLWDTAGQERYRSLAASSFRDAKGFIIVYDITNKSSFAKLREDWLRMTDMHSGDPVPVFFVGNKADLGRLREVAKADAEKMTQQQYAHGFFETSARTGYGVQELFKCVATSMLSTWGVQKLDFSTALPEQSRITLEADKQMYATNKKTKDNCCKYT